MARQRHNDAMRMGSVDLLLKLGYCMLPGRITSHEKTGTLTQASSPLSDDEVASSSLAQTTYPLESGIQLSLHQLGSAVALLITFSSFLFLTFRTDIAHLQKPTS